LTPPRGTPASLSDFRWATSLVANTRSHAPSSVAWAIAADSWGGPLGEMVSPSATTEPDHSLGQGRLTRVVVPAGTVASRRSLLAPYSAPSYAMAVAARLASVPAISPWA